MRFAQWLAFLHRKGVLDPSRTPGERATDARLSEFVTGLCPRRTAADRGRVCDSSIVF
jgi:hypothetical protein